MHYDTVAEPVKRLPAPIDSIRRLFFMRDVFLTRRKFTDESWQLLGRLFGGSFQQFSKEEIKRITINGEPVVELDIKSCHATMAFAHVGID